MNAFFDMIRSTGFRRGPSTILGGVCSGMARQWGWNENVVRLVVLILLILPLLSWVVSAIAWILLPWQDGTILLERWISPNGSVGPNDAPRPYDR